MKKDWTGNTKSVYSPLGSSHHSDVDREMHDFYATEPRAVQMLLKLEQFDHIIWEPACGTGHISEVLTAAGYHVRSTDLIDRGFGVGGVDFLSIENQSWNYDIITNPPYKYAKEFIYKALEIIPDGKKIAMFLKVQFLEGKGRKPLFTMYPPKTIHVSSSRLNCALNGQFEGQRISGGSAVAYAWYIWQKGFNGVTELKWFN